jgi:hypothetical protein
MKPQIKKQKLQMKQSSFEKNIQILQKEKALTMPIVIFTIINCVFSNNKFNK